MPHVILTGFPVNCGNMDITGLIRNIKKAVAGVIELGVTEREVSVDIIPSLNGGSGGPVIARIVGMFERKERTDEVKAEVATAIANVLSPFVFDEDNNKVLGGTRKVEAWPEQSVKPELCCVLEQ